MFHYEGSGVTHVHIRLGHYRTALLPEGCPGKVFFTNHIIFCV